MHLQAYAGYIILLTSQLWKLYEKTIRESKEKQLFQEI